MAKRTRAPNGSSSIYLGKDKRWHTYVTVGHKPDGALDRRHIHRKTAGEVAKAVDELKERMARSSAGASKAMTVEQWLTYWLENVVRPNLAYSTSSGYTSIIKTHLIPHLGQWRMDGSRNRLEPEHVEAMILKMRKAGLASTYVLQTFRILSKATKDAMRRGRAGRNVCDMIDPPKARGGKVDAHSLAEAQALLSTAMTDRNAARWLLGILLGPRQGEALGLRWHRLHLESDQPHMEVRKQLQRHKWQHGCDDPAACAVRRCRTQGCAPEYGHGCDPACGKRLAYACPDRRAVSRCARHTRPCPPLCPPGCTGHASACPMRRDGGLVEVAVKSQKGERDIPLPPVVVEQLRLLREVQIRWCAERGRQWDPKGFVFINDEGRPMDPRRDHAAWERLLQRAGVPDSRLHAARHTAATSMLASGTDSRVVQEIMGHSRIAVTEGYIDVAKELKRQAVDRVAAALMDGQITALLQAPVGPSQRSST